MHRGAGPRRGDGRAAQRPPRRDVLPRGLPRLHVHAQQPLRHPGAAPSTAGSLISHRSMSSHAGCESTCGICRSPLRPLQSCSRVHAQARLVALMHVATPQRGSVPRCQVALCGWLHCAHVHHPQSQTGLTKGRSTMHACMRSPAAGALQVLPKGEVLVSGCYLEHNRRGQTSGNGVRAGHA